MAVPMAVLVARAIRAVILVMRPVCGGVGGGGPPFRCAGAQAPRFRLRQRLLRPGKQAQTPFLDQHFKLLQSTSIWCTILISPCAERAAQYTLERTTQRTIQPCISSLACTPMSPRTVPRPPPLCPSIPAKSICMPKALSSVHLTSCYLLQVKALREPDLARRRASFSSRLLPDTFLRRAALRAKSWNAAMLGSAAPALSGARSAASMASARAATAAACSRACSGIKR